jgi:hypothetical protein
MTRLASLAQAGYYPTPLARLDDILPRLNITEPGHFRLFDPCAGKGEALAHLAQGLQRRYPTSRFTTWGVEISDRAVDAKKNLNNVVQAPFESSVFYPSKCKSLTSLVLLNPPYQADADHRRMEHTFLERVLPWMPVGSILLYIIPFEQMSWGVCQTLVENFEDIHIHRFPDEEGSGGFDIFGQVVVLAKRKDGKRGGYHYDKTRELYNEYGNYGHSADGHLLPTVPRGTFILSPSAKYAGMRRRSYTPSEIDLACEDDDLYTTASKQLWPTSAEFDDPLRPPRDGHVAQMIAGGMTGTMVADGTAFKGIVIKKTVVVEETKTSIKTRDVYTTHVARVSSAGMEHFDTPELVATFLKEHAETFREHILTTYKPYGNHAKAWEERLLDTLSKDKCLPGRKPGLLRDQRDLTVSLCRAVERHGVAHLIAEMGYGKTRTSLAAVELMNAYPALITCPPHLVTSWQEEAEASVPGCEAVIVETITELEAVIQGYNKGGDIISKYSTPNKWAILTIKWEDKGRPVEMILTSPTGPSRWRLMHKDRPDETPTFVRCSDKLVVIMATSKAKLGPGSEGQWATRRYLTEKKEGQKRSEIKVIVCPECGREIPTTPKILEKKRLVCGGQTRPVWDSQEKVWRMHDCQCQLWQNSPTIARRWPLADYIRRKHKRFFKMYIPDEVHKHKAKGTNVGYVLQWLSNCCPTITLTGTFFGGAASSIFYLLYRTQANVRREFSYEDEKRWVERFGVIEKTFDKKENEDYSVGTGRRRRQVNSREKPGLSPEAIRFFLPTTCFAKVTDLGLDMPAYQEEIVDLGLGAAASHISWFEGATWAEMIDNIPHWTSSWLQWNLARPNSCFRDETIEWADGREEVLPAVIGDGELLEKEEWLVSTIKSELAGGRKVVVYPRQTGTRDIRSRLVEILAENGVRSVSVLDSSVTAKTRRRWLARNSKRVLITNPRLVETGMNLHDYGYCTILFYEIEYSLYTLWQAMSRVWRPGQTKGVKVFFSIYGETLEGKALAHIGKKMLAGQLLYGDDVSSALVEDSGDAGLVLELIKAIQSEKETGIKVLKVGGDTRIFGLDESEIESTSVIGSPTVKSRKIVTMSEWLMKKHGITLDEATKPKRSRKKATPQAQMSLF